MVIERRDLHYPDLQSCHVVLSGTPLGGGSRTSTGSGGGGGPVSLPREALDALTPIPPPHDFGLEREVISNKDAESKMSELLKTAVVSATTGSPSTRIWSRTHAQPSAAYGSMTKSQRDMLEKMKTITNASEQVCLKLLKKNRFMVDASVEAYYRGDR